MTCRAIRTSYVHMSGLILVTALACGKEAKFGGKNGVDRYDSTSEESKPGEQDAKPPPAPTSAGTTNAPAEQTPVPVAPVASNPEAAPGDGGIQVGQSDAPEHAVKAGSFSVWTEPKDPGPKEDYEIYIEVLTPKDAPALHRADLSGVVNGTDGYKQSLSPDSVMAEGQRFKAEAGKALLVVWVPGTVELIRDVIEVQSESLNETQSIEITF